MKADIVLGCGFGDEGKGSVTNMLSMRMTDCIVVRFSGGQQAGHTVMYKGKKHTFSNFGAGTLTGKPTYFTEHTTIFLNTLANEKRDLHKLTGRQPSILAHPFAKLTTPYDVAYGRLRERKLGHGSVGLGVGATMKRHAETGYKLFAIDLHSPVLFRHKLEAIRQYYLDLIKGDQVAINYFNDDVAKMDGYFKVLANSKDLLKVNDYSVLNFFQHIVFEGSQGILLDMDHGIFPHVTFANTTSKNAIEVCEKLNIPLRNIEMWYVTRCYQTRHGNGPMTDERDLGLINNHEEINVNNEWQKNFRTGELDYELLNYAISIDKQYSPIVDRRNLVVTCIDQRPEFKFEVEKVRDIMSKNILFTNSPEGYLILNEKQDTKSDKRNIPI